MFKKKSKKIEIPLQNPPEVVKTSKNFRIIVRDIPLEKNDVQIGWKQQLVIEERLSNAMKEPFWITKYIDIWLGEKPSFIISGQISEETMWAILRELFLNETK